MARRKSTNQIEGVETAKSVSTGTDKLGDNESIQMESEHDPDANYQLIIERGEAHKLSPKSDGKVYYHLALHAQEQALYLKIEGNDGGGLHSKEWVGLQLIIETLTPLKGQTFKSTVLKKCMVGKSSNNASFLAAVLRSPEIKLIQPCEDSVFSHALVADFDKAVAALLSRKS